jgi:hypothetical protein
MKTTILKGVVLFGALALASCSTTNQLASSKKPDDDVYFSNAKAGDQPEYREVLTEDRYVNADESADEDDYYYYDSYSSRINRFNYMSPFGYYDDYYYGYSPYGYGAYAYGSPYGYYGGLGGGWGIGIGLGYGYGGWGSPYGYGYGYSPYSYWGTGYGYGLGYGGGYPYWGVYSAYTSVGNYRARPNRQFGSNAGVIGGATSSRRIGYNGNYPTTGYYPGRASTSIRVGGSNGNVNYGGRQSRGVRDGQPSQPTYRPTSIERPSYNPGNSSSGGGGGRSSGGGGGGARPSRP